MVWYVHITGTDMVWDILTHGILMTNPRCGEASSESSHSMRSRIGENRLWVRAGGGEPVGAMGLARAEIVDAILGSVSVCHSVATVMTDAFRKN